VGSSSVEVPVLTTEFVLELELGLALFPLESLDIAEVFPPKDFSSWPPICAPSSSKAFSSPDYSFRSIARVDASGKIARC